MAFNLFSKDYVCAKCGKSFTKGRGFKGQLCDACVVVEENQKKFYEAELLGYVKYARQYFKKEYSAQELSDIQRRRDAICQSFGESMAQLNVVRPKIEVRDVNVSKIAKRFEEQRANNPALNGTFFIPFENVVVDSRDIFAVAIKKTAVTQSEKDTRDYAVCQFFTNDPLIPVFAAAVGCKHAFIGLNKESVASYATFFQTVCPNLTYPLSTVKELTKAVRSEGRVRGNMNIQFMLNEISNFDHDVDITEYYDSDAYKYLPSKLGILKCPPDAKVFFWG